MDYQNDISSINSLIIPHPALNVKQIGVCCMEKSKIIFGNEIDNASYKKACKTQEKSRKKYGDDSRVNYVFREEENETLKNIGVKNLRLSDKPDTHFDESSLIVGNIRMGYGHYRISIAIASAAHALGYTPYWLDLNSYPESTATKIIAAQNDLYSLGSRISQKSKAFNKFVWEPINYEGFRKLTYNAPDQKNAELMVPLLRNIPKNIPYIATHAWPAQAAVHAGFEKVVNAIPDNWPMALHLAEGSIHTVQTANAYLGYKMLHGMDKKRTLKPMPEGSIVDVGHYIDHELVSNIEKDCEARLKRAKNGAPRRFLLTIGGAGAQQTLFEDIIKFLIPYVKENKAALLINAGDHRNVWDSMEKNIPELKGLFTAHFNCYEESRKFVEQTEDIRGIHVFCEKEIFPAVYITNLLLRVCDFVATKPSELAFYPTPKLMIHRVGGHEMWGAIHTAEVGDGTYECDKTEDALAMIREMTESDEILRFMCSNIIRAKNAGLYNGAYEAVKIAFGK